MILYNVTVKIDPEVSDEWVQWMKDVHIPDVMRTDKFNNYRLCRLLDVDESDGVTYAVQYEAKSMDAYEEYQKRYAPELQQEHTNKFRNRFVAFRTIMEIL